MGKDWKQWIKKKGLEKYFRRDNLLILVLAGILLFIIALPTSDGEKADSGTKEKAGALSGETLQTGDGQTPGINPGTGTDEDYAAAMEQRLTEALADMAGVGKVRVMITLKSSRGLVVEKEEQMEQSSVKETDSQGGSRISDQVSREETVVRSTDGSNSEPYVVKSYVPEIEGVLVVAEGAGSGTINRTVTEVVQALFGVEAHKVKVVKMNSSR
ncbi:MAG: stage III sporulation protein AG [Acetatifactor sp.]|nr:stage III sporulation protein AG [Acetatifactor sp.]MDE7354892.1 stage III sporulation protein AG [Acetatifactor sp.]